jgi:hypothetical protein
MSALDRLVLWCLRNARTPENLVWGLKGWVDLVREVRRAPNGAAAFTMIFRYIFMVNERFGTKERSSENRFEDVPARALDTASSRRILGGPRGPRPQVCRRTETWPDVAAVCLQRAEARGRAPPAERSGELLRAGEPRRASAGADPRAPRIEDEPARR